MKTNYEITHRIEITGNPLAAQRSITVGAARAANSFVEPTPQCGFWSDGTNFTDGKYWICN